jgi:Flp pilus assembly protein TadG
MFRFLKRVIRNRRGVSLVETALACSIMLPVAIYLMEMSMYCYTYTVLQYASRAGVQYAATHGTDAAICEGPGGNVNGSSSCDASGALVKAQASSYAAHNMTMHKMNNLTVTPNWPKGTNNPGDPVTVTVNYPYQPMVTLPFIPATIQGTATGKVQY